MCRFIYQDIFHQSRTEETIRFVSHIDPSIGDEKMPALMSECIYLGRIYSLCPVSLTPHPYAITSPWSRRGGGKSKQEAGWARVTIWLSSRHFISATALGFGQMVPFHWAKRRTGWGLSWEKDKQRPGHLAKGSSDNKTISGRSPNLLLSECYPLSVVRRHWFQFESH